MSSCQMSAASGFRQRCSGHGIPVALIPFWIKAGWRLLGAHAVNTPELLRQLCNILSGDLRGQSDRGALGPTTFQTDHMPS